MDNVPPRRNSNFAVDEVDDIDATCAATEAAGDTVATPLDLAGAGQNAMLQHTTGAIMEMMTPEPTDG